MMLGTLKAGASCSPGLAVDNAAAAAALASCTDGETQACLPKDALSWQCAPKAQPVRRASPTSIARTVCTARIRISSSAPRQCTARKAAGTSCTLPNECMSLYCKGGQCVDATVQAAYCLAG